MIYATTPEDPSAKGMTIEDLKRVIAYAELNQIPTDTYVHANVSMAGRIKHLRLSSIDRHVVKQVETDRVPRPDMKWIEES